jgi:hypothetical protein
MNAYSKEPVLCILIIDGIICGRIHANCEPYLSHQNRGALFFSIISDNSVVVVSLRASPQTKVHKVETFRKDGDKSEFLEAKNKVLNSQT